MRIDLTSSLYLGLYHSSASLPAWRRLTTGAPAALVEPPGSAELARELAASIGGAQGLLMSSTLHVFVDLFMNGLLGAALFCDAALYPVASIGVELARGRGAPVRSIPHLTSNVDARGLERHTPRGRFPVIVTDGFCVGCGRAAPLAQYVGAVRELGGLVVVDDTQALGLLGADPTARAPFGSSGGGSARHQGLQGESWLIGASLAKAWGAPIACLVGPSAILSALEERGGMLVHSSAPSRAAVLAARRALNAEARVIEQRRRALAEHIIALRQGLAAVGIRARGGLFPVQSIAAPDVGGDEALLCLHETLAARGVITTISRARCSRERTLTLVLRADHRREQIQHAVDEIQQALARVRPRAELVATLG
jgi:8-amino-7-oxononanoate synthase